MEVEEIVHADRKGVAFVVHDGEDNELTRATVSHRNPPLPSNLAADRGRAREETQATLAVSINGRMCDCIYISRRAVDAHKLPTPAGWYVEVPDEEGVHFSVRHAVSSPHYPTVSKVFVDGQQACRWELKDATPRTDHGFWCQQRGSLNAHVQPFKLQKVQFADPLLAESDTTSASRSADGDGGVGTIILRAWEAAPRKMRGCRSPYSQDPATFVQHSVDPEKKSTFVDRAVTVGTPFRTSRRWVVCALLRGRLVVELKLHYRTRRFFDVVRGHIRSRAPVGLREENPRGGGLIKHEQQDAPGTFTSFVRRLARHEAIPAAALQPLLSELAGRRVYTAHQLRGLTRSQWREIMHAAGMPASLARSATKLASPPPTELIIIIDG